MVLTLDTGSAALSGPIPLSGTGSTAAWTPAAPLAAARYRHTASLLQDGSVMVGFGYLGDVVTEIFMPGP